MFTPWDFDIPPGLTLLNAEHIQLGQRTFHWGSLLIFNYEFQQVGINRGEN
jgi:hypothetical protein